VSNARSKIQPVGAPGFGVLCERGPDLYSIDHPLRIGGVDFGTRTSLVLLPDGGVLVHSPGPLGGGVKEQVESLGPVRALVAPNCFHHLYVEENLRTWPDAALFLAPGLAEKKPALPSGETLGNTAPALWKDVLEQRLVRGMPKVGEVVFFHPKSHWLLLTDLAFNFHDAGGFLARQMLKIMGAWDRFGPSRLARSFMKDKDAIREDIDRILEWDFERILLGHGDIVQQDARALLRDSYREALRLGK